MKVDVRGLFDRVKNFDWLFVLNLFPFVGLLVVVVVYFYFFYGRNYPLHNLPPGAELEQSLDNNWAIFHLEGKRFIMYKDWYSMDITELPVKEPDVSLKMEIDPSKADKIYQYYKDKFPQGNMHVVPNKVLNVFCEEGTVPTDDEYRNVPIGVYDTYCRSTERYSR